MRQATCPGSCISCNHRVRQNGVDSPVWFRWLWTTRCVACGTPHHNIFTTCGKPGMSRLPASPNMPLIRGFRPSANCGRNSSLGLRKAPDQVFAKSRYGVADHGHHVIEVRRGSVVRIRYILVVGVRVEGTDQHCVVDAHLLKVVEVCLVHCQDQIGSGQRCGTGLPGTVIQA